MSKYKNTPKLNKEIVFKCNRAYLKYLFEELKKKKIDYFSTYSPFIDNDIYLSYVRGSEKALDELNDYENFVYSELQRVTKEYEKMSEVSK